MKRSEMLEQLTKRIELARANHVYSDDLAEYVLLTAESFGMEPPILEDESFKMLPGGELTYAVHRWEQE